MININSEIKFNFQTRTVEIEAWFYAGQKFEECPDWVQSKFQFNETIPKHAIGKYALRDEDGYFWRWMVAEQFNQIYVRINP